MTNARETGLKLFAEVYGAEAARGLETYIATDDFGVEIARWTADFVFPEIWARDGLERKLRSCVVLGMLIALRQPEETRYHTKMGMANGLTPKEIEEILYTAVPYCGIPAANTAKEAMRAAFRDVEAASTAKA